MGGGGGIAQYPIYIDADDVLDVDEEVAGMLSLNSG
jgi:hypothetical protein